MDPPDPTALLADDDPGRSWRAFLESYAATVYRAAERATADPDEARDAASEVLRSLAEDWPEILRRFKPASEADQGKGARFTTWLAVVARRRAIDVLRSRYGRDEARRPPKPIALEGDGAPTPAAVADDPEQEAAQRDLRDTFVQVLAELSGAERGLLRVYFLEGVRADELRRMFGGKSNSQVYNRVHTLMNKLRRLAEQAGLDAGDTAALAGIDWESALTGGGETP